MSALSQIPSAEFAAACRQGATEAAEALGRVFDCSVTLAVGQPSNGGLAGSPAALAGPGLAIVLKVGQEGAVLVLPNSSGLVPAWSAEPDATGKSRLATLAQELGMLILPSQLVCEDFLVAQVANLADALRRAGLPAAAPMLPLELQTPDGRKGTARLFWPASAPDAVLTPPPAAAAPRPTPAPKPAAAQRPAAPPPAAPPPVQPASPRDLPGYAQSLLRIRVPVVVTLAHNRQPLWRVIELGPGSILHFEKSCEEMLDLELGGRTIAAGEAVKVGDKFGLRITSIVMPDERFKPIAPRNKAAS